MNPTIKPLIRKFVRLALYTYSLKRHWTRLLLALGLSALSHFSIIGFMFLVGSELGAEFPLIVYFFMVSLGFIISSIPLAPLGLGVSQSVYYFLILYYTGSSNHIGPSLISSWQLFSLTYGVIGGIWFLISSRKEEPKLVKTI